MAPLLIKNRVLIMIHCCLQLLLWGQVLFHILPQRSKAPPKDLDPFCPTPASQAHPQNSKFLIQRVDREKCWNAPLLFHASAATKMHEDIWRNTATHSNMYSTRKVTVLATQGLRPQRFTFFPPRCVPDARPASVACSRPAPSPQDSTPSTSALQESGNLAILSNHPLD